MANTGFKGIDVRQTGNQLVFRAFLQDSLGAIVTSGTTTLYLYELQSDGTLKSYDFNDNTFKTGALTTETQTATHRQGNNSTTNTGVWTYALSTLTGFTVGGIYIARIKNTNASPTDHTREFQYGSAQGDLVVTSTGTGTGNSPIDLTQAVPTTGNTAHTVGDALNAARAQGFGKWVVSETTLTLYANDGSTVVHTFTLDSATAPTSRS